MATLKNQFNLLVNDNTHIGSHGIAGNNDEVGNDVWQSDMIVKLNRNKRWTAEDRQFVIDNYISMGVRELSQVTGRTEESLRQFASQEKLTSRNRANYWTREDLLFVRKKYRKMSVSEIAKQLDRTKSSVAHKITLMNIAESMLPTADTSAIQKNVPYYQGKQSEYRALMLAMNVNDSFEYPANERQTIANCMPYFRDRLFKTKKIDDHTRRVWRVL